MVTIQSSLDSLLAVGIHQTIPGRLTPALGPFQHYAGSSDMTKRRSHGMIECQTERKTLNRAGPRSGALSAQSGLSPAEWAASGQARGVRLERLPVVVRELTAAHFCLDRLLDHVDATRV